MQWLGLGVAQLAGVLVAAASLTIALYLLKQRRRKVTVPFIALWETTLGDRRASQLFARLKHLLSLLLALTIVTLLTVALGDPRPGVASSTARHTLLLIDAGVTMQTRDVPGGRLAAAKALGRRLVAGAGGRHFMLVAQLDSDATPLSPMTDEHRTLEAALDHVVATDLPTRADNAYRFALDMLRGRSHPELVVISDSAPSPSTGTALALQRAGVQVSYLPVGRRNDDVGISSFAVRRYPLDRNRSELLIELYNSADHAERATLTLLGDGAAIDAQPLTLEPRANVRRVYDDVTGVSRTLEARLAVEGPHNDLQANDRAYAVLPERRRTRVLCVSDGNRYLEAALLLDEYLDVEVIAPSAYTSSAGHDVVIFDTFVPRAPPEASALYLRPESLRAPAHNDIRPSGPLEIIGEIAHPVFARVDEKHPVVHFTALHDVNVKSALLLRTKPGDQVLAADARGPLIVAGERAGRRFVTLAFDIRESDLPLRVAWPLLLLNTLDWFTSEDHPFESSSVVGKPTLIAVPPATAEVRICEPGGAWSSRPASNGTLVLDGSRAGFYRAELADGDRWFAMNLSPSTRRDLTPARRLTIGSRVVGAPKFEARGTAYEPFAMLLLVAWVLLALEWLSFHRRWTV